MPVTGSLARSGTAWMAKNNWWRNAVLAWFSDLNQRERRTMSPALAAGRSMPWMS